MSSTDVGSARTTEAAELSKIDMGLEVVTVPVSDVDRALRAGTTDYGARRTGGPVA